MRVKTRDQITAQVLAMRYGDTVEINGIVVTRVAEFYYKVPSIAHHISPAHVIRLLEEVK